MLFSTVERVARGVLPRSLFGGVEADGGNKKPLACASGWTQVALGCWALARLQEPVLRAKQLTQGIPFAFQMTERPELFVEVTGDERWQAWVNRAPPFFLVPPLACADEQGKSVSQVRILRMVPAEPFQRGILKALAIRAMAGGVK